MWMRYYDVANRNETNEETWNTQDNEWSKFPEDAENDGILNKYQQIHLEEEERNIYLDKHICRLNLERKYNILLQLST